MILKTVLITVVLVAIVFLGLGVKMFFDKNAKFTMHSCSMEEGSVDSGGACVSCELRDTAKCPENQELKKKAEA